MPPTPGACGLLWMAAPPPTDKLAEMAWSLLSNWQKKSLSVLPQEFEHSASPGTKTTQRILKAPSFSARKENIRQTKKTKTSHFMFCQKLWFSMDFWERVMLLIVVWPKWFKSIPSWPIRINPLHSSYNRPCWLHDVELGHPSARNTSYNLGESHCCIAQYPGGTIS